MTILLSFALILCLPLGIFAQTGISTISTSTVGGTATSNTGVVIPSDANNSLLNERGEFITVNYGVGNNLKVSSYVVSGTTYDRFLAPDTLVLNRAVASDRLVNIWFTLNSAYDDNAGTVGDPDIVQLDADEVENADAIYLTGNLNAGYDNILVNDDDGAGGSIQVETERVDIIWYSGIQTSNPGTAVFPIIERGGNDNIAIAAITSLNADGTPAGYGTLIGISENSWPGTGPSFNNYLILRREAAGSTPLPLLDIGTDVGQAAQVIQGVAVSFTALGISADQSIFGYSIFSADVVNGYVPDAGNAVGTGAQTIAAGIDLTDISTFPSDTKANDSGIDLVAGVAAAVASDDNLVETKGPGGYKGALTTWLKANVAADVTTSTDGSPVSDWQDHWIGDNDATTGSTSNPTYRSSSSAINFNPTVDFTTSNTSLTIANNAAFNTGTSYTNKAINLAFRTNTTDVTTRQVLYEQGGTTRGIIIYIESGELHLSAFNRNNDGTGAPWNNGGTINTASTGVSSITANTEYIVTLKLAGNTGVSGTLTGYLNGTQFASMSSVGLLFADTDGIELGGSDGNIQYDDGTDSNLNSFRGEISEFIYCNEPASFPTTQRDRIESYLAIKYGITLDQASPNNYVNSDGDIIFNTTISAALGGFLEYNNDIAGIGRDDAAELEQLSSKSENAGSIVQVDRNTDIGNDDSWLIWGNDGAPTTASRTESKPNTINERLERVWRVAEEKSVGVTDVSFDLMGLGLGNDASDFSILIANNSSNGDFSGATVVTTGVFVGDVLTFPDLNLTDGQYFTLGTQFFICTPGNVQDGLSLWIKADAETYNTGTTDATDGQTVATWGDQSRNDFDALNNGNRGPLYVENSVNFNPGLNWNAGTNTVGFNLVDNYIFAEDDGGGLHVFSAVEPVDVGTNNSTRQRKMIYSFGNRAAANVGYGVSTLRGTIQSPGSDQNSGISTTGPSFIAEADYDISAGASDVRRLIIDGNVVRENTLSFQLNDAAITQNSTHASNRGPVSIGRLSETNGLNNQNGRRFFGEMSEVIVYNEEITDLQEQQVRSYLAIKYGTTLTDDNNDNSTANEVLGGAVVEGDYVASDGTTITWDYSDDTGFVNNVAGIGRDDDTCLEQRQSRSVNSDAILTVGLGEIATTNADNPNTFDDDLDFLTWGTDGASTDFGDITTAGTPGTVTERMLRVWRAQDTGDVGPTDISFDLTTLPGYSANAADYQLIIAGGGDNTSLENGTTVTGGTFDGTVLTFSGVDLADGQYFTLGVAADLCGPGGITTDMVLWLRGDQGTSTLIDNSALNTWTDQSLGANNGVQDGNAPLFRNDPDENINFNPTVEFDGTNDRLSVGDLAEIKSATGTGRYSMFGIGLRDDATTNYVIGSEGGTTNQDLHFGYRNSTSVAIAQWGNDLDATVTAFDSPVATPFLIGAIYDGAGKVIEESRDDNFVRNTNNNTVDLSGTKTNFIGDLGSVGNYNGRISEVLVYNRAVTTLEKLQIYSYFAIKYGITLTQDNNNNLTLNETISGSVAEGDLVASDGTTIIWDESFEDYDDYHNGMAGIGRDDAACLNQKQSTSATDGTILTMGLGTITSSNAENTGLHDNLDFLVWGHDGVAADKTTAEGDLSDLPSTVSERMRRVWRVEDTGTVDATEIQFDLTSLGYSTSDASDYRLIIADASSGGTMAGGTLVTGGTFNGDVLSFTGIDLTDGQYFTLGTALETCGPGGVNTNIALWLRADLEVFSDAGITAASDGNNVEQWNDQSSPADNGSESNLGGGGPIEPTFETNEINFNPVLNFTDPNSSNASYIETGTNSVSGDMTLISVFRTGQSAGTPDDFENSPTLIGASETTSDLDYGLGMQNGTIWVHANSTAADVSFDAQTGNTFRNNEPHFVTATRTQSSGTITIYVDANSEATGTGSTTALTAPTSFGIGNHSDGNQNAQYNGDIAESIVYSSVLTSDERNRVESYLALKYGLTMDASDDGGTGGVDERDYRAADGGDIWDFDGQGATYYNDIFGIGRDDLSCFEQTSAKSENNDALVTFEEPSGSFDTNDSFIVSGNDNADIESTDNTEKPDGINSRLNREWRVQETGTVGTIELTYDLSTITGPTGVGTNNLTQLRLLVDDDGDFSNGGTTFISPSSIDGSNETATFEVDFTDGQYYTLGSIEIAALPITLISFEVAVNEDNEVKLDWTTATEVNNSFYTIERSTDGINFETVANIDGAGNSNAVLFYTYVDTKPVNGLSFYRLKQTDFNGEFDYSQVRSVRVAEIKKEFKASYKAYPNPIAKGEVLKIGYELEKDQTLSLIIINRTGQVIRREEHTVFITEEYIEVSTKGFETGLNLIRIIDESGNTATLKIIIR